MPTPVVIADKMSVGGKNGGKHSTKAEVEARQEADELAKRKARVSLRAPAWVKESEETLKVWRSIVGKLRGIELLDNLDAELLAVYCDAIVRYRESTKQLGSTLHATGESQAELVKELIKAIQAEEGSKANDLIRAIQAMNVEKEEQAPVDDLIKATQAWARIMVSFAEKLGLTPGGRARLAKRKAEKSVDEFAELFEK